jgi:hypothetical protein
LHNHANDLELKGEGAVVAQFEVLLWHFLARISGPRVNPAYCLTALGQMSFVTATLYWRYNTIRTSTYSVGLDIFRDLLADLNLCISSSNFRRSDSARSSTFLFSK